MRTEAEVSVIDGSDGHFGEIGAGEGDDSVGEMTAEKDVAIGELDGKEDAIYFSAVFFECGGLSVAGGEKKNVGVEDGPETPEHERGAADETLVPGKTGGELLQAFGGSGRLRGGGDDARGLAYFDVIEGGDPFLEFELGFFTTDGSGERCA